MTELLNWYESGTTITFYKWGKLYYHKFKKFLKITQLNIVELGFDPMQTDSKSMSKLFALLYYKSPWLHVFSGMDITEMHYWHHREQRYVWNAPNLPFPNCLTAEVGGTESRESWVYMSQEVTWAKVICGQQLSCEKPLQGKLTREQMETQVFIIFPNKLLVLAYKGSRLILEHLNQYWISTVALGAYSSFLSLWFQKQKTYILLWQICIK